MASESPYDGKTWSHCLTTSLANACCDFNSSQLRSCEFGSPRLFLGYDTIYYIPADGFRPCLALAGDWLAKALVPTGVEAVAVSFLEVAEVEITLLASASPPAVILNRSVGSAASRACIHSARSFSFSAYKGVIVKLISKPHRLEKTAYLEQHLRPSLGPDSENVLPLGVVVGDFHPGFWQCDDGNFIEMLRLWRGLL